MSVDEAADFIRRHFGRTRDMQAVFLSDPGGCLSQTEAEELGMDDEVARAAIAVIESEWGGRLVRT